MEREERTKCNVQGMRLLCVMLSLVAGMAVLAQDARELDLRKLTMARVLTEMFYVDSVNSTKLTEDAIRGMLKELDPHSSYSNAKETQKLNEPLQGSFDGIGVSFNILEDTLIVLQPITKGPSEKVGILAGDRIISVNDTAIAGVKMERDEIMRRLRGPRGSVVKLGVRRNGIGETVYFKVTRDKIPVHTLDAAYMIAPQVGYIRFSSFGSTTHKEVCDAIERLQKSGMQDLIIDLQGNGGGYLQAAGDLGGEFLEQGDMIVYTRGRAVPEQEFRSRGRGLFRQGRLVVLVDEYSASAAEILSGAIQDQDRGVIVGRRTFGKGLVQRPVELPDGSMIRLTTARYYTPAGRCIQKPYTKGDQKSYAQDVVNRYNRGELTSADSIHFPDSLRYTTLRKGRTVYGGGGIMPDVFVPIDTLRYTKWHRELSAKGVIINTNLKYIDKHRKALVRKYKTFDEFNASFEVPDDMIAILDKAAREAKVEPKDEDERSKSMSAIKMQLKALVARDLWDMSEYFQVINTADPVVTAALEQLKAKQ